MFSLGRRFYPPWRVGKGLSHFRRLLNSLYLLLQIQLGQHRRAKYPASWPDLAFPKMLERALPKIDTRSNTAGFI